MVQVYVSLILKGKRTLNQVPEVIRDQVIKELAKVNGEGDGADGGVG